MMHEINNIIKGEFIKTRRVFMNGLHNGEAETEIWRKDLAILCRLATEYRNNNIFLISELASKNMVSELLLRYNKIMWTEHHIWWNKCYGDYYIENLYGVVL
jgi:hypothetical protein